ncbi:MAG: AgmX/PglI C-terminal domain-containing protein [Bdellovibrionales bacterium]|nr:AgmX/PglI C-terminal domain-containing protein [Bdellovibrionales bacterium]
MKIFIGLTLTMLVTACETAPKAKGFDKEAIRTGIWANISSVKTCYERVKDPKPEGKVVVNFGINSDGTVQKSPKIKETEIKDEKFLKCLTGVIEKIKFPAPPQNVVGDVTYPFVFANSEKK